MLDLTTISIADYLCQKNIDFVERNNELITWCIFNDCDRSSKIKYGHLYFSASTGQYDCKKRGNKGNMMTLAKFLGDDNIMNNLTTTPVKQSDDIKTLIKKCNSNIPVEIRKYLNDRMLDDNIINDYMLGYGEFYGKKWITIPIKGEEGKYVYLKLRRDPNDKDTTDTPKYLFYPKKQNAVLFNYDSIIKSLDREHIFICEGEFDCILLNSKGIPAVTSTTGASSFKEEWIDNIKDYSKIYICFDNDPAGKKGADDLIKKIEKKILKTETAIYQINLPEKGNIKDVTDYFASNAGTIDKFISELPTHVCGRKPININQFKEITPEEIKYILGLTIKRDYENKLTTFLCMLSAYTEDSQFNISFNAPSSTGKSYIPLEVKKLFPKNDVMVLGGCSPSAFFHETGTYDKARNAIVVDLERKIIIFTDQPDPKLLEKMRPLLSHDEKDLNAKITDKTQKFGTKTKNIFVRGFPSVIFCSAGLKIDEQECTRFILLSPESNQEKIKSAISEKVKKEADKASYENYLNSNPYRESLKDRIEAIKNENIKDINIENKDKIENVFLKGKNLLKPRHQRDIGRFISLIKCFTLLNLWFRKREGDIIFSTDKDIERAIELWDFLSESQDYNLPPYVLNVYKEIILPCFKEKNEDEIEVDKIGLSRNDIRPLA
ncbi:hypothetical protein AGMMS49990_09810 [Endomicrobiia bacterium]|nr:hypothetical protein AGMMS49990_09810 [Endomicrobiia bacterium]